MLRMLASNSSSPSKTLYVAPTTASAALPHGAGPALLRSLDSSNSLTLIIGDDLRRVTSASTAAANASSCRQGQGSAG